MPLPGGKRGLAAATSLDGGLLELQCTSLSGGKGKCLTLCSSHVSELEHLQSANKEEKARRDFLPGFADQGGCRQLSVLLVPPLTLLLLFTASDSL